MTEHVVHTPRGACRLVSCSVCQASACASRTGRQEHHTLLSVFYALPSSTCAPSYLAGGTHHFLEGGFRTQRLAALPGVRYRCSNRRRSRGEAGLASTSTGLPVPACAERDRTRAGRP